MYYDNNSLCADSITEVYILLTLNRFDSLTIITNTSKFADFHWLILPRLACFQSKCLTCPSFQLSIGAFVSNHVYTFKKADLI